ncbi:hypothetical protein PCE1_001607 [Barthelona sp. PCE]
MSVEEFILDVLLQFDKLTDKEWITVPECRDFWKSFKDKDILGQIWSLCDPTDNALSRSGFAAFVLGLRVYEQSLSIESVISTLNKASETIHRLDESSRTAKKPTSPDMGVFLEKKNSPKSTKPVKMEKHAKPKSKPVSVSRQNDLLSVLNVSKSSVTPKLSSTSTSESALTVATETNRHLESQIKHSNQELLSITGTIQVKSNQLMTLEARKSRLEAKNNALKEKIVQASNEVQRIDERIAMASHELHNLEKEEKRVFSAFIQAQDALAMKRAELSVVKSRAIITNEHISTFSTYISQINEAANSINHNSTSGGNEIVRDIISDFENALLTLNQAVSFAQMNSSSKDIYNQLQSHACEIQDLSSSALTHFSASPVKVAAPVAAFEMEKEPKALDMVSSFHLDDIIKEKSVVMLDDTDTTTDDENSEVEVVEKKSNIHLRMDLTDTDTDTSSAVSEEEDTPDESSSDELFDFTDKKIPEPVEETNDFFFSATATKNDEEEVIDEQKEPENVVEEPENEEEVVEEVEKPPKKSDDFDFFATDSLPTKKRSNSVFGTPQETVTENPFDADALFGEANPKDAFDAFDLSEATVEDRPLGSQIDLHTPAEEEEPEPESTPVKSVESKPVEDESFDFFGTGGTSEPKKTQNTDAFFTF